MHSYDAQGNRTARWMASGSNETQPGVNDTNVTTYVWDNRNRLTSVKTYSTYAKYNAGTPDQTVAYIYGSSNRWISETITPATGTVTQTRFIYDGNQIVMQFDGTGTGSLSASNFSHRYLWAPAVDQLLADEQVTNGLGQEGNVVWTLGDNLNTGRDLATYDWETNTTTVVNHRVFSAYGQLESETIPDGGNATVTSLFAYSQRIGTKRLPTPQYKYGKSQIPVATWREASFPLTNRLAIVRAEELSCRSPPSP
jgi:hypothetical protein